MLLTILISLAAVMALIVIHELGHFAAARILGIPVFEFSIGLGPEIASWQSASGTKWSLRLLPFGGYCSFDPPGLEDIHKSNLFGAAPVKRLCVLLAGPLFNLAAAFLISLVVFAGIGVPVATTTIEGLAPSVVVDGRLQAGDVVVGVNGHEVPDYEAFQTVVQQAVRKGDQTLNVVVQRGGKIYQARTKLSWSEDRQTADPGLVLAREPKVVSFGRAIVCAFMQMGQYWTALISTLGGLLSGAVSMKSMSGVVGIVSTLSSRTMPGEYVGLLGFLSFNLFVMNLLPLPVLDGWKALTSLIEMTAGYVVPAAWDEKITTAGAVALVLFFVYVTCQDVARLTGVSGEFLAGCLLFLVGLWFLTKRFLLIWNAKKGRC